MVSAGNTGAVMATAKMIHGMVRGVKRPALAAAFPTFTGNPVVLLDVGANVDCTAEMLAQFAVMGEIYSRVIFHVASPRVGLLSIGEEEHKGNELTRAATPLLKSLPLNFVGNVEGRDLFAGTVDVIVCDGFIGNVALKVSEGLVEMIKKMLQRIAGRYGHAQAGRAALAAKRFAISASAWIIRNTAARRCWASRASPSFATGGPTATRSRTPFGWRPSSQAAAQMRK